MRLCIHNPAPGARFVPPARRGHTLWPVLILAFGLALAGCKDDGRNLPTLQTDIDMRVDGTLEFLRPDGSPIKQIQIEIAETEETRRLGLMNRRSLTYDDGMLFVFEETDTLSFWMRNTPVPLDMIFVGPDSQVVNIARRTRPLSDTNYSSTAPARYVIEVRAGFADRFGISDSTQVRWVRTS